MTIIEKLRADILQAFTGYQILESPMMTEYKQIRFPRSKKKRIQKKWRRRPANYAHVPMQYALKFDNTLLMHPALARKLEAIILNPKPREQRTKDQLLNANTFPIWNQPATINSTAAPSALHYPPASAPGNDSAQPLSDCPC